MLPCTSFFPLKNSALQNVYRLAVKKKKNTQLKQKYIKLKISILQPQPTHFPGITQLTLGFVPAQTLFLHRHRHPHTEYLFQENRIISPVFSLSII